MAQLNNFSGGLNIRTSPHLISISEAQEYINIDNSSLSLRPIKQDTDEQQEVYRYMINFNDTWISSSTSKTYQKFQAKLYYSDGIAQPKKSSDGVTWYNLGIQKPKHAPDIVLNTTEGTLNGTLQYCYTYYNANDGTESEPSRYSAEIIVVDQQVDISVEASTDIQVTDIRLYRLGGNLNSMQLVTELDNSNQTYTDNIDDLSISGHVLDTFNNAPAPTGLKYLTENNAMFFGAKEDKLYYSDVAYVDSWSLFNFIDFDYTITGIGPVPNGLLVFTEFKTYIITGTTPDTLSKYLLNNNQGCLDHKSIQYANNSLIWISSDGICVSNGAEIQVISRDKLGKNYVPTTIYDAIVYDDVYYLAYSDGILLADFRFGTIFRHIDTIVEGLCIYNDILYYSKNNNLYSLATSSENKSLVYKSPKFADGQISNLKNYKVFYLNCIGNLQLSIYIDGDLVLVKDINTDTKEVLIPQQLRRGYYVEFKLSGTGELLELEYIVEGRQNGR